MAFSTEVFIQGSQPFILTFVLFLHLKVVIHLQIYKNTFPLKIIAPKTRQQMLSLSSCKEGVIYKHLHISLYK